MKSHFVLRSFLSSICLLLASAIISGAHAQQVIGLPPIEVKRFSNWAPEYLTVTNTYDIEVKAPKEPYWGEIDGVIAREGFEKLLAGCPWIDCGEQKILLGSVITQIDAHSTKGMSEGAFSALLQQDGKHTLKLSHPAHADREVTVECLNPEKKQELFDRYNIDPRLRGVKGYSDQDLVNQKLKKLSAEGTYIDLLDDENFDWSAVSTYDFVIRGNDPLADAQIMAAFIAQFPFMTRDTQNPDLLVTISKNAEESISSTYVPPTTQVIREGSTTRLTYNWVGRDPRYETKEHYRVEESGDYTKTTTRTELFLELCILDAKRVQNTLQTTPPLVYQLTYKRHVADREFNIMDEYKAVASAARHPLWARCKAWTSGKNGEIFYGYEVNHDNVVTYVHPNGPAFAQRVRVGDKLTKRTKTGDLFTGKRDGKTQKFTVIPVRWPELKIVCLD